MNIKIWKRANNIYLLKSDGTQVREHASRLKVQQRDPLKEEFEFEGEEFGKETYQLSAIQKENGDTYTSQEFTDFIDEHTGFNAALGGSEAWDLIVPQFENVWHTVTVPDNYRYKIVSVVIRSNMNNNVSGVREVGSTLDRSLQIDIDCSITMLVNVNKDSQIQIYTEDDATDFYIEMTNIR